MRINIYHQEITDRVEVVTATAENTGAMFLGIRFYLASIDALKPPHHADDDSSAITFWVPSSKEGYRTGDEQPLIAIFCKAILKLTEYEAKPAA